MSAQQRSRAAVIGVCGGTVILCGPCVYAEYSTSPRLGPRCSSASAAADSNRATCEPLVQNAWTANLTPPGSGGRLADVCESTGTRGPTDGDYPRRTAILGRNERGGGMAMCFATEFAP